MKLGRCILAIDQGTTSSRAIVFTRNGDVVSLAQREFAQHYPQPGWVEHDPEEIWRTVVEVARAALRDAEARGGVVAAIGLANQRETTLVWDRKSGAAIYNAVVWQDRRTADVCEGLRRAGSEDRVRQASGLVLDPYFSATKIAWILDNVEGARARAEAGDLAAGTIDSFLVWRMTGGARHATDATNASRTSLFNIHEQRWDRELLEMFRVPKEILPEVRDCADDYGRASRDIFGRQLPIAGVVGDQQGAAFGQAGFRPGAIKATYGTGSFILANTGDPVESAAGLLTTIAYRLKGELAYALEGSIFVAGAAIQWLRDELGLIRDARETEALARSIDDNQGVYLVPAFAGLGAPHWRADARGALIGLTRGAGKAAIARAALEAVAYQTADLLDAVKADGVPVEALRIDGGMVANDWLAQFLADTLAMTVERPAVLETTALGAAYLAGLQTGLYTDKEEIAALWRQESVFSPRASDEQRRANIEGWKAAVRKTLCD